MSFNFLSSLSQEDNEKLINLSDRLSELLKQEGTVIEEAKQLVDRMKEIKEKQAGIDQKGNNVINENGSIVINNSLESEEFMNLLITSNGLTSEENNINYQALNLNSKLEEISKQKQSILEIINSIISTASNNMTDESIFVEEIGEIQIGNPVVPDLTEQIITPLSEIINCNVLLIVEMSDLFLSNVTKKVLDNAFEFNILKQKVDEYKTNENNSLEKQFEMINMVSPETEETLYDDNQSIDNVSEDQQNQDLPEASLNENISLDNTGEEQQNQDLPEVSLNENISLDNTSEEQQTQDLPEVSLNENISLDNTSEDQQNQDLPEVSLNENISLDNASLDKQVETNELVENQPEISNNETQNSNIQSIEDILGSTLDDIKQESTTNDNYESIINIKNKIELNQVAKATKDKLYNTILSVFEGSYPKTKINDGSLSINSNNKFNMENFVNGKTA